KSGSDFLSRPNPTFTWVWLSSGIVPLLSGSPRKKQRNRSIILSACILALVFSSCLILTVRAGISGCLYFRCPYALPSLYPSFSLFIPPIHDGFVGFWFMFWLCS